MKLYAALALSSVISTLFSQENSDYVVKLNKDTVFLKSIKMDSKVRNVICEGNGKKIKYQAKDILAAKIDTVFYESGLVRLKNIGSKHIVFLQKTVVGDLTLYEINVKRTKFLWKTFGKI
ncbi:MAG: hypothetical protein IPJ32_17940 [Sphingobacteriaceae bacterium]|nr:hypothetical protein [Sphingobacteriaceae bacterium]